MNQKILILDYHEFHSILVAKRKEAKIEEENHSKIIRKNFKWYLQYFLFYLIKRNSNKLNEKIQINQLKRILVFRNDGIGDFIVSNPIFLMIKEFNPNVLIDVITSDRNDFYIKKDPLINQTFKLSDSNFKTDWKNALNKINQIDYDLVYLLNASKTSKAALMCRNLKVGKTVSFDHFERHDIYNLFFDKLLKNVSFYTHWSEKMVQFPFQTIDFGKEIHPEKFRSYLYYTPESIENAKLIIEKYSLKYIDNDKSKFAKDLNILYNLGTNEYIIFCISAFSKGRSLTNEQNIELIKSIREMQKDKIIFVTAAPSDYKKLDEINSKFDDQNIICLKSDFYTIVTIYSGAKLLISPDTANSHIAAAANVPALVFYHHIDFLFTWYNNNHKSAFITNTESHSTEYMTAEIFKRGFSKLLANL